MQAIFVLAAYVLTIVVNFLANFLPINNVTTGEVSDAIPVLITPAGYVFIIWAVIYLALLLFVLYQFGNEGRNSPFARAAAPGFILASLFNSAWIFAWHYYQYNLSLLLMIGVFGSLLFAYLRLRSVPAKASLADRWLVSTPFSLYLGWISFAMVANASVVLYLLDWQRFGLSPEVWTVIMMAVAMLIGLAMLIGQFDAIYAGVFVWALIGIGVNQTENMTLALVAFFTASILVAGIVIVKGWQNLRSAPPPAAHIDEAAG